MIARVTPAAPASLPAVIIAGTEEPGTRIEFTTQVLDYDGRPLSRAAVVAYHADSTGLYNPPASATRIPRIRTVAVTGDDGRVRFSTVRPDAYPDRSEPAHIHLVVTAPAACAMPTSGSRTTLW